MNSPAEPGTPAIPSPYTPQHELFMDAARRISAASRSSVGSRDHWSNAEQSEPNTAVWEQILCADGWCRHEWNESLVRHRPLSKILASHNSDRTTVAVWCRSRLFSGIFSIHPIEA